MVISKSTFKNCASVRKLSRHTLTKSSRAKYSVEKDHETEQAVQVAKRASWIRHTVQLAHLESWTKHTVQLAERASWAERINQLAEQVSWAERTVQLAHSASWAERTVQLACSASWTNSSRLTVRQCWPDLIPFVEPRQTNPSFCIDRSYHWSFTRWTAKTRFPE